MALNNIFKMINLIFKFFSFIKVICNKFQIMKSKVSTYACKENKIYKSKCQLIHIRNPATIDPRVHWKSSFSLSFQYPESWTDIPIFVDFVCFLIQINKFSNQTLMRFGCGSKQKLQTLECLDKILDRNISISTLYFNTRNDLFPFMFK